MFATETPLVHPNHCKPCVGIWSLVIAIVPAWEESQLESVRGFASQETFLTGGHRHPPCNMVWYQHYMQLQFVPGNCCPEIFPCKQLLLWGVVQAILAPGNCCPEFLRCPHPFLWRKRWWILGMMWCPPWKYTNLSLVTTYCINPKSSGIPYWFKLCVIHEMRVVNGDSRVHPIHCKHCIGICSLVIAFVPAWDESQLESVRGLASQETFLTGASDTLHAIWCGINTTYNCSLFREIVVPRVFCAISYCSKGLCKLILYRGIVVPNFYEEVTVVQLLSSIAACTWKCLRYLDRVWHFSWHLVSEGYFFHYSWESTWGKRLNLMKTLQWSPYHL